MSASDRKPVFDPERRRLLQGGLAASGVLAIGPVLWSASLYGNTQRPLRNGVPVSNIPRLAGSLHEVTVTNDPDTRMLVPEGFSVREVARTGRRAVAGSPYVWHGEPDGGAVFAVDDGGWIYVSNSEINRRGRGGVGALRFDAAGELVDSYSIAEGTTNNCAGGSTPWGTWLTCEEINYGLVHECDPFGREPAVPLPALGAFKHEAAAVDPVHRHIYMTEDTPDGNFYRFVPDRYPEGGRADPGRGRLQVAVVDGDDPYTTRPVSWADVPEPVPEKVGLGGLLRTPTRRQVKKAATFNGGEGCWYHDGVVYFSTKGDNRVWAVDTNNELLDLVYDKRRDNAFDPGINNVDNITVSAGGDILVAEDGDEMRIVVVGAGITPFELVNIRGHHGSEVTGPAFNPDGSRLYFSSQRGPGNSSRDGRTYEMRGPFFMQNKNDSQVSS